MHVTLYRKYRPKQFKDVISQNNITTTLKNEVKLKKIAHAYVFSGPKGTGKTSCAKIFSKAINCTNPQDGEPCLECNVCKGLEDEALLDVTELDAASNNGVNDIRFLKDEASFVPSYCKFRVYILDEVHMLSSSAFNALLKIMESPPKHLIFILATTDVYKIPSTVLSRCQRFDFNRINLKDMEAKIEEIAGKEKIKITKEAVKKIVSVSQGSMRDALSILEKCAIGFEKIGIKELNDILNIVDESYVLSLHKTIKNSDYFNIIKIINKIYWEGKNLENLVLELINFYREMLYYVNLKEETKNLLEYCSYFEFFKENENECFNFKEVNLMLENFLELYEKIKYSSNQKFLFEVFTLRVCENISKINFEKIENSIEKIKNNCKIRIEEKQEEKKDLLNEFIDIAKNNNIEIEDE